MRDIEIVTQTQSDLTTLQATKNYLQITTTDKDDILEILISSASDYIKNETNQEWVETSYKESIDGEGNKVLILSQKPIIEVTTLTIDGEAIEDYFVYKDSAMLKREDLGIYNTGFAYPRSVTRNFPVGNQNIVVEYKAGYSEVPQDLQQAVWIMANATLQGQSYEGLSEYSIGDETIKWNSKTVPNEAMNIIERYKSVV